MDFRFVCETAGNLQGMLPGDLGDMGKASLNEDKIFQLLQMVLSDASLESYLSLSTSDNGMKKKKKSARDTSTERRRSSKRGRQEHEGGGVDSISKLNPLSKRERRYLELSARILRCAQRYFLMDAERNASKDNNDNTDNNDLSDIIIEDCVKTNNDDDDDDDSSGTNHSYDGLSSKRCIASVDKLADCPWVTFLMKGMCSHTSFGSSSTSYRGDHSHKAIRSLGDIPKMAASKQQAQDILTNGKKSSKSMNLVTKTSFGGDDFEMRSALQKYLCDSPRKVTNPVQVRVYLQIICACAEIFPRGECWSSTNMWYRSTFSPMDNNADLFTEGGDSSYCNACSSSDMAALIHSITDILCRYGTTGGDLNVQMWALICLTKLTECSNIAMRYWKKQNSWSLNDDVPFAWQRVWNILYRHDLRYVSYTSNALTGSHGELVLVLLTEIMKGSLTSMKGEMDAKHNLTTPFLRKNQDKVWNLPVFKSAAGIQISAPFEFISMLLNRAGLVEGESDAFTDNEFDNTMLERMQKERLEGTGRRYRIICFCINFIRIAVMRDERDLLRRIIPFATTCFASLTGNNKLYTSITTFSMQSMRTFRTTETRYCLNENEHIPENESKFSIIWKDAIDPFSFQYSAENNPFIWDDLNGRDIRVCPPWPMEERRWLKSDHSSKSESFDHISSIKARELQIFGLNTMLCVIGYGVSVDEQQMKAFDPSFSCRIAVSKCILAISLLSDFEISMNGIHWRFVEEMFESIFGMVVADVTSLLVDYDHFSSTLSDFVGILRLIKESHVYGKCPYQVRGLLSSKHLQNLHAECNEIVKKYVMTRNNFEVLKCEHSPEKGQRQHTFFNDDSDIMSGEDSDDPHSGSAHTDEMRSFSSRSEAETDDDFDDSDDNSRKTKKRKGKHKNKDKAKKQRTNNETSTLRINSESLSRIVDKKTMDAKGSWLCAYILVLLKPSEDTCNDIVEAIIWPPEDSVYDTSEPHDCILCLGLFNMFIPLSPVVDTGDGKDTISILSQCVDLIGEGRDVAGPSSPYHMFGFRSCQMLMNTLAESSHDLKPQEIEGIIQVLRPETANSQGGKKSLRSMKIRPIIRILRVQAAIKCFTEGNEGFHKKFDSMFEKIFVVEALIDQSFRVRRVGIDAVGAALKKFPLHQQNIVDDALNVLPPLQCNTKVTDSDGESFENWVEDRTSRDSKSMMDIERRVWKDSFISLQANILDCISIISGKTSNEEISLQMVTELLQTPTKRYTIQALCFKCLEKMAFGRNFKSLEDQIRTSEFDYIQNWVSNNRSLLSLPITLCCPSVIRYVMRIGCQRTVDFSLLQENVADEYVLQKASTIIPCVLIDQFGSDNETVGKRDRYIKEIANVCVDGNVGKLLRSHIHDIYAFTMPMIHYENGEGFPLKEKAEEILSFIQSFSKLGYRYVAKSTHLVVTQILHLYGRGIQFDEDMRITKDSCFCAIKYFAKKVVNKKTDLKEGLFQSAGTSTTECLLYARRLLDKVSYSFERNQIWRMIDLIIDEVETHTCMEGSKNSQFGFCVSSLLSMSLDKRHQDLRCSILLKTKAVLEAVIKDHNTARQSREELSYILNKLVATMIQIHEECQDEIINFCLDSWQSHRSNELTNMSFEDIADSTTSDDIFIDPKNNIILEDSLGLAINKYGVNIPKETGECTSIAFEILELLLDKKKEVLEQNLVSLDPFPEPNITARNLEILMSFNEHFCLCDLLHSFEDSLHSIPGQNLLTDAKRFESIAKRYIANKSRTKRSKNGVGVEGSSLEARTLLSGIDRLRKTLPLEIPRATGSEVDFEVQKTLAKIVQFLCNFCYDQYPCDIQVAASSCLGSLIPTLHEANIEMNQINNMHVEKRTYFQSNPLGHFFGAIFEHLASYVQSEDTETAIIAKDTLKTLLLTKDGLSCWKEIESKSELKRIVSPFLTTEKTKYEVEDVPPRFLKNLMTLANLKESDLEKGKGWCWCDDIWKCNAENEVPFEDWVRNIVCAILMCCYRRDKNEQSPILSTIQGSSDFFRPCVKLCAREFYTLFDSGMNYSNKLILTMHLVM